MNIQAIDKILGLKPAQPKQPAAPKAPVVTLGQDRLSTSVPAQYTVRPGDSLANIAYRFRQPVARLLALNPQLTQGARRRPDGTLIFPGDVVKLTGTPAPTPAPAPLPVVPLAQRVKLQLDTQQIAAAAKVEKQRDQALAEVKAKQAALEAEQKKAAAAQSLAQTKFQLATYPQPSTWNSLRNAQSDLDDQQGLLEQVPEKDPDYPTLDNKVQSQYDTYDTMEANLATLGGHYNGKTKRGIEALDPATIALATSQQKADLIHNLTHGDDANDKAETTILAILADAKRQGQLNDVLADLHTLNRKVLGLFPDHHYMTDTLPFVMSDKHLDAYEQLITGTTQKDFVSAIADERDRRAQQQYGG